MVVKSVIILFGLFNNIISQINDKDTDEILRSSTIEDNFDDIFEGFEVEDLIDDPVGNITVDGCECVPYYLCDNGLEDEPNSYVDWEDETMDDSPEESVECPHYLLKCCDDEDLTSYKATPDPPYPPKLKGCGYHNINFVNNSQSTVSQFGEFPWVVAVYYTTPSDKIIYVCGGALIHPEVVLTAAHCIKKFKEQPRIRAGEWDFVKTNEKYPHQDRDVSSVIIHEGYSSVSLENDVALVFLKKPFELAPHINVVCLPPTSTLGHEDRCVSTGWGRHFLRKDGVLTKVELSIVPRTQCEQDLSRSFEGQYFNLHESFICARGDEACAADGGSPLICQIKSHDGRYQQVGIASWDFGCGSHKVPGVYTNVALFKKWIDESLRRNSIDVDTYQIP